MYGALLDNLEMMVDEILNWDGNGPGYLFKAVKSANPDAQTIASMRELNKCALE